MKFLGEQKALEHLAGIMADLRAEVTEKYEHRAKSCLTCETQGACCLDAHFVNVHISQLEAAAIRQSLSVLRKEHQEKIHLRVAAAIDKYSLTAEGDTFSQTYACPLFEKGIGCLVHEHGKPVPCIVHACYESAADLPPDELQMRAEIKIEALNARTYGRAEPLLPLPLALRAVNKADALT
jgi:hypothetical protein